MVRVQSTVVVQPDIGRSWPGFPAGSGSSTRSRYAPAVRAQLPDETDTVLEALEEHHVVKWLLSELDGMTPDDERFAAKFTVSATSAR